jgi:hypothetical protein
MLGIRASPSGAYILVLLKGAPAELWALGKSGRPFRVRLVDLPFTAVEWVLPEEALAPSRPGEQELKGWPASARVSQVSARWEHV